MRSYLAQKQMPEECSPILEDIIESVTDILEKEIERIEENLGEADADDEQKFRGALANASLYFKLTHLALTILRY